MAIRGHVRQEREEASPRQRLLSPQEAAKYLGLGSRWAVRRLVVSGALPVVKLAGKWRLDLEDLDKLIASRKSAQEQDSLVTER